MADNSIQLYIDLWSHIKPVAEKAFEVYRDDGRVSWSEALEVILTLYPAAYDYVDGLDIPNIGEEGSKHNLVCKAMDEVFDAIADPDAEWIPNWIEVPLEKGLKLGLHIMTHVIHKRATT